MLKILCLSTPVGALGSGIGGGVELSIYTMAKSLMLRGHALTIVAPMGSKLPPINVVEIAGNYQISAQNQKRDALINLPANSTLENMWEYARSVENNYDIILNFAYDWLPLYLTSFFTTPVAHVLSMGSLNDAMDTIIHKVFAQNPLRLAFRSFAQAETFRLKEDVICLKEGIDLDNYEFSPTHQGYLAWVGRISPEKALEDGLAVAQGTQIPLKIFGKIQNPDYWQQIQANYPDSPFKYEGFLSTQDLQTEIRQSCALLMTPRWVEAFGNVVIEALACGVPVIAYNRGGPKEIIQDGKTGFLVEPDNVQALIQAVHKIEEIDRFRCRQRVEKDYSLEAMGARIEAWCQNILEQ